MFKWLENMFLNEEIKFFQRKEKKSELKTMEDEQGEGVDILGLYASSNSLSSFNLFYNKHFNQYFKSNVERINEYRSIATMPEVADVIEDAVNECTQENDDGDVLNLELTNETMLKNKNIIQTLEKEFDLLFFKNININQEIWRLMYQFFIDGCMYYERLINIKHHKEGIKGIKLLPPESMDFMYDYRMNNIEAFIQYLKPQTAKRPISIEEAKRDDSLIVFIPAQIGFIPYKHGKTKNDIMGYLDNCRVAYNQLKLLETSVIIYRLVRAPERFVFKIDVGNMPKDKALKYVNKIKQQMNRKQSFDPNTGVLEGTNNINCIRQNTQITLLDGRNLPLIDVIKEFNEGKQNWAISMNKDTKIVEPNRIVNAAITRRNEKLIRIHLDHGFYHDTTYDHKWILRNGNEVEASSLIVGDSLMSLYAYEVSKIEYIDETDDTGCITVENNHNFAISYKGMSTVFICNSLLDNIFIPQSDSRGSDVTTIGGNSAGFTELEDVKYFAKKLYRSLKYPISRVENAHEGRSGDNLFGTAANTEVSRDEVKWGKFLERQQRKFCDEFKELFLLHLDFKGIKGQYNLTRNDFDIYMKPPSEYQVRLEQQIREIQFANYSTLSNEPAFSKTYLMQTYLEMDDDDIKANIEGFKTDKLMRPEEELEPYEEEPEEVEEPKEEEPQEKEEEDEKEDKVVDKTKD